ncbi:hypothetical protein B0O79_1583 [Flavobacteriaceae bacterium MAR_2009_75]|nr:hypothetical protein B0O79_1583 [Flavobacteriaceae bacterium MAR_2009_75]
MEDLSANRYDRFNFVAIFYFEFITSCTTSYTVGKSPKLTQISQTEGKICARVQICTQHP